MASYWQTSDPSSSVVSPDASDSIFEQRTDGSSAASSIQSASPSKQRTRPASLRLHAIGLDPAILVGKVLTHVRRSLHHPNITLEFSDGNSYQILVDGYDPMHRGVPRTLEMDEPLVPLFEPTDGHVAVDLPVSGCTLIRMIDKAFDRKQSEQRWDQSHLAMAFKFGDESSWHCVWAALNEHDAASRACVFRSYDDVYLERRNRQPPYSPRKRINGGSRGRHERQGSIADRAVRL